MDSRSQDAVDSGFRWAPPLFLCGALAGVVLLIVGMSWSNVTTPATFWSDEQAKEYQEASDAVHAASHAHGESSPHPDGETVHEDDAHAAARERYERIKAELERAQYARDRLGPLLTLVGLAASCAFGIGYLMTRRDHN